MIAEVSEPPDEAQDPLAADVVGFGFVAGRAARCSAATASAARAAAAVRTLSAHPSWTLRRRAPAADGGVSVKAGFNNCPTASVQAAPTSVRVGQTIDGDGHGSDIDPDDAILSYMWTRHRRATSATTASRETTFTCTDAGPVTITVTVSDGSCRATANVAVFCVASGTAASGRLQVAAAGRERRDVAVPVAPAAAASSTPARRPSRPAAARCARTARRATARSGLPRHRWLLRARVAGRSAAVRGGLRLLRRQALHVQRGDPDGVLLRRPPAPVCYSLAGAANGPCVSEVLAAAKTTDPVDDPEPLGQQHPSPGSGRQSGRLPRQLLFERVRDPLTASAGALTSEAGTGCSTA